MSFTLQVLLGLILVLTTVSLQTPEARRFKRQVNQIQVSGNSTKNSTEIINNRDLNKIQKTEPIKHIENLLYTKENATTEENVIEKQTEETNSRGRSIEAGDTSKNSSENANKIQKIEETSKENGAVKKPESSEDKFDLNKFIAEEFHIKNTVYTFPPDHHEDFYGHGFEDYQTTPDTKFEVHSELTTPKTPMFDQKYKETVEGVNQNLENSSFDDMSEEDSKEIGLDQPTSVFDPKNNTKIHFKQIKAVLKNDTNDKNTKHKNTDIEEVKGYKIEKFFNETKIYDTTDTYPSSDESGSEEIITTTTRVIPSTTTTRKNTIAFTKPSTNKNISHLLNNKIEKENIKAINTVSTTPITTITTEKVIKNETTIKPNKEQSVLENNFVTQAITPPKSTTEKMKTTTLNIDQTSTTIPTTTSEVLDETTLEVEGLSTTETLATSTLTNNPESTTLLQTTNTEQTTTEQLSTTTTELIQTTENFIRTSKSIHFETTETSTTSDVQSDQTTPPETITTALPETTTEEITTEQPTTTTEVVLTTTRRRIVSTTTEKKRETTEQPTTTQFAFVHIKNVDVNHTTLQPETLKPSYGYPTPDVIPAQLNHTVTEEETTTEDMTSHFPPTEDGLTNNNDGNKGTIAAIVISSVGAVCLVILAGLLFIMRKRQRRFNYGQRCRPVTLDDYSMDNVSVYNSMRRKAQRLSKRSYGNPAFEDPVVSHPLNFPALAKFANNLDDIKAEFDEIPQIVARTSELPEGCDEKNRYANVIPLPETRVFLNPIENYPNSDYINANYVTGPKDTKGYYIATQGPLQNTVDDFWRMVWEQHSKVILMITHLFENGVEKCVDYLPPSEVSDCHRLFGDFQVTLKKREAKEKYIISSIQLKNMVSNSWREVTHFWYLGWPEKGVPTEANSLIAFLIEARSYMKSSTLDKGAKQEIRNGHAQNEINPVVVHCSPGTGRTGVVIACDIAIREFEQSRLVDVPKIVYKIRRDRASAVQTKEQYQFVYRVVSLYATKLTGGALDSI